MKNTKHTPGPWTLGISTRGPTFNEYDRVNAQGPGNGICLLDRHPGNITEANARLIAAAPELLEIAIAYRNLLKTMAHTEGQVATFQHIESVLAKATGEES